MAGVDGEPQKAAGARWNFFQIRLSKLADHEPSGTMQSLYVWRKNGETGELERESKWES